MSGIIYCVTNPSMNNYCKVGETGKTVAERMRGLNNTSVPTPFNLEYYIIVKFEDRFNIESSIHDDIIKKGYIRNTGKEFFRCLPYKK